MENTPSLKFPKLTAAATILPGIIGPAPKAGTQGAQAQPAQHSDFRAVCADDSKPILSDLGSSGYCTRVVLLPPGTRWGL
ncbi:hypothetical protein CHLRE_01g010296v5 [Chlamydomonas reinhardtii]|uniref:Uncharacterized protein n=1 Tax=Chlamydomonas reinhardtii TaxID=3055 RepID=A0A2K3E5D7_CHLRE|nr:uncharacterized protein CHLRE_01g010296v5 [Chlamydomonas reinhardtii]PNW88001.1 hypothetical protein CHLRE_01g010296v5 [Chlamydomonas reinhardtii]